MYFSQAVNDCGLFDLGFKGPKFTWNNMRKGVDNVQERLDKAFGNQRWLQRFRDCQVRHLPRSRSNHNPLIV